jgi:hypothetical protein
MLWALADYFVDELIELYRFREDAERALDAVLTDEPGWEGMIQVVPVALAHTSHWHPRGREVRRPRCRRGY